MLCFLLRDHLHVFCCGCCCQVALVVSDSVRPHRRQPTRLRRPWDSPDNNTGVGFHFLLQCMKVKSESEVGQSCPILCDPMNCRLPGSSVHGSFQAIVLEWGAIAFSIMYSKIVQLSKYIECNGESWFSLLENGAVNWKRKKNTSMYHIILDWNQKYYYI